ncbi:enoyl-CoA hydratase/isomerase family protein [Skermania sp. ID1734]|uniref:enoyl-CoA hydratase/isomerase family protein n=1 Tax=Skermania sp. ID1734 TaxID=2597516 RepID=UPI00117CF858|nr:enoyl-CoA hydratase/isomerase family protein [Skermania sp. ID1734]TSD93921.1 enoyl-CoA hydratase/isomerase family protein [Skermania sp. ID1734]
MTATDNGAAEVLIERRGRVGHLTLNRPKAINALNHSMVHRITEALTEWGQDSDVETIVITGAGERGLCAGGDIVSIYHDAKSGGAASREFWRDEYILNAMIASYPKPYVAVMDGLVMGGGIGVSAHGSHRIVTERSALAMPEVGIGFVPDVGGTYLMAHGPGELGTHMALTTTRLGPGDAIVAGFADHFVPVADIPELLRALEDQPADDAIGRFAQDPPESALSDDRDWIDECYSADTVEIIVARLRRNGQPDTADAILSKSPTAVKVALRSLRRAREAADLETVLNDEYRVSLACLASSDFFEGIRAQVIDKDRNPRWSPPTLEEVGDDMVAHYFAERDDNELGLVPTVREGQR